MVMERTAIYAESPAATCQPALVPRVRKEARRTLLFVPASQDIMATEFIVPSALSVLRTLTLQLHAPAKPMFHADAIAGFTEMDFNAPNCRRLLAGSSTSPLPLQFLLWLVQS